MSQYRYFSDDEVKGLDKELCAKLDMARDKAGVPFTITCGLRTPAQNAVLVGAAADSSHLSGQAVDLATMGDDHIFNRMIYGLCEAGLDSRMGFYFSVSGTKLVPHHIHVDASSTLPQQTTWNLMEEN